MFPSDRWELALEIEADRMSLAAIDAGEVEAERQVIGEERARELESPQVRLDQTLQALAYIQHPYRNPVLGWPEDLARIGVADLRGFYRGHYRPDGAVLVLAGDVDPEAAVERAAGPFRRDRPGSAAATAPDLHRAGAERPPRFSAGRDGFAHARSSRLAHGAPRPSRRAGIGRPGRHPDLRGDSRGSGRR